MEKIKSFHVYNPLNCDPWIHLLKIREMIDGLLVKMGKAFVHIEIIHVPVKVVLIKFFMLRLFQNPEITIFFFNSYWRIKFSSVQLLSHVRLFATSWIAARQASLSITSSRSSLRLTSIESVLPSSHLILCSLLFLLPPIPPSIRVFTESTLLVRWPKYLSLALV